MFLTKKSFIKILVAVICYFLLGNVSITLWAIFRNMGISEKFLLIFGIILYLLCVLVAFWGRYAEGKGKLVNLGNKLVRNELKPSEFIDKYENLINSTDLIVKKPSIEVLQLVTIAYDSLDQRKKCTQSC